MNDPNILVALTRCSSYDFDTLEGVVEKLAGAVFPSSSYYHGKVVLLKPNLISSTAPALACTHKNVICAVAVWFKNNGARVVVGDSPAFGNAGRVCEKLGIADALAKHSIEVVNFTEKDKVELPCGVTVPVARSALECDLFVGLPKIKAHNQMGVTLALKNIFGIVTGMNKALLHMIHGSTHTEFAEIIFDLLTVLPPQLHIADGIEAMHHSGPLDGEPLKLNCLAASSSPVALDAAIIEALEVDRTRIPLLQVARMKGDCGAYLENLAFVMERPDAFHGSGFVTPEELNGIRFNPFRFLRGTVRRGWLKISG